MAWGSSVYLMVANTIDPESANSISVNMKLKISDMIRAVFL